MIASSHIQLSSTTDVFVEPTVVMVYCHALKDFIVCRTCAHAFFATFSASATLCVVPGH